MKVSNSATSLIDTNDNTNRYKRPQHTLSYDIVK